MVYRCGSRHTWTPLGQTDTEEGTDEGAGSYGENKNCRAKET